MNAGHYLTKSIEKERIKIDKVFFLLKQKFKNKTIIVSFFLLTFPKIKQRL